MSARPPRTLTFLKFEKTQQKRKKKGKTKKQISKIQKTQKQKGKQRKDKKGKNWKKLICPLALFLHLFCFLDLFFCLSFVFLPGKGKKNYFTSNDPHHDFYTFSSWQIF
jgi:hypothetical protein